MNQNDSFKTLSIPRLLLKFSIPAIVGATVQALYNIIDRIYIGQALGSDALAGVTLTFPIFILSIAIGVLFGNGNAAIISLKLGEGKKEEAEKTLGTTFFLFTVTGICISALIFIFMDPLLKLVGATSVTMPYAKNYLTFFLPALTFDFLAMGTNGGIRSEGNPTRAMLISMMGCGINIILDPIFLFVFGWGVEGVALATAIARIITTVVVILHFTKSKKRHLSLRFKYYRVNKKLMLAMMSIGVSPCILNLATSFVAVFSNRALLNYGGDTALAALGVVLSVFIMIQTPIRGLQMGAQPIIGFNYGAKKFDRVYATVKLSYFVSLTISFLGLAIIFAFAPFLVQLFSRGDSELLSLGVRGLKIYHALIPLLGLQMITVVFYQATGNPKKAIIINIMQSIVFYLVALFSLPLIWGLDGVWGATSLSHLLGFILSTYYIIGEQKRFKSTQLDSSTSPLNGEGTSGETV